MTFETAIALGIASFIVMVAPGPGTLATVGRALTNGFAGTLSFILGIVAGDLAYLLFAIFGLSAIAALYGDAFTIIRWVGAAYLIYLGVRAWTAPAVPLDERPIDAQRPFRDFLGGLMLTLGNPKVILFYTAFLPTFLDLGALQTLDIAWVAAIVLSVLFLTMVGYAWAAARSRRLFRSAHATRILNRTSGGVLVGAGAYIAARQ